jgi:peptide/nickel transport system permease protein
MSSKGGVQDSVRVSYLAQVWQRLRKNRIAVFGIWCILLLIGLALFAPLLSLNQPFYFRTDEGVRFPFFTSLLNRLLFENGIDLFFNLLLLLLPLYLLLALVSRHAFKRSFSSFRYWLAVLVFHNVLFMGASFDRAFGIDNPLYHTEKVTDYAAIAAELEEQGTPYSAVFPLRRFSYRQTDPGHSLEPPSSAHWLGTDSEGRDVFARMLYGTRISLTIGVVAVAIYVFIGVVLGACAGYFGGRVDMWLSRLIEVMICFPTFFLILTLAALIEERSIFHVMVIIGVTSWTGVARLIRAEFLKHKNLEYAQAALALGLNKRRVIFLHILPNAIAPVLVSATFGIASAILVESSLAFLGIGDLTVASWGETLSTGRTQEKLWLILAPGFAIFFVVSVFNLVGEGLRDALDPKLKS